jgi:hypothetical protein
MMPLLNSKEMFSGNLKKLIQLNEIQLFTF